MTNTNYGPVPCPTCGQSNSEPCIRGRKPRAMAFIGSSGWGSEYGGVWQRGEIFSQGHDSRRSANKKGTP